MKKREKQLLKEAEILKEMEIHFPLNSIFECLVIQLTAWGILVKFNHHHFVGCIRVIDVTDEEPSKYLEKYPKIHDKILARVMAYTPDNGEILLSIKPSVLKDDYVYVRW